MERSTEEQAGDVLEVRDLEAAIGARCRSGSGESAEEGEDRGQR